MLNKNGAWYGGGVTEWGIIAIHSISWKKCLVLAEGLQLMDGALFLTSEIKLISVCIKLYVFLLLSG